MKRLMIMRHGEAEPLIDLAKDKERKLTRKGRSDMQLLHLRLLSDGLMPEFALASDALRTEQTLKEATGNELGKDSMVFTADLYNAAAEKLIDEAQLLNDQYRTVLIVAHSPGVYQAVMNLVAARDQDNLSKKLGNNYKSGTVTVLDCPIEKWSDLKTGSNQLVRVITPD